MIFGTLPSEKGTTIVVVHSNFIIAADLSDTLREIFPLAQMIVASEMQEACSALSCRQSVQFAFVESGPSDFAMSGLAEKLDSQFGRAVLMGDKAERQAGAGRWPVLFRPFFAEDIRLLLG